MSKVEQCTLETLDKGRTIMSGRVCNRIRKFHSPLDPSLGALRGRVRLNHWSTQPRSTNLSLTTSTPRPDPWPPLLFIRNSDYSKSRPPCSFTSTDPPSNQHLFSPLSKPEIEGLMSLKRPVVPNLNIKCYRVVSRNELSGRIRS